MSDDTESSTRFQLTLYMLGAVLGIVIVVMILAAINIPVPDFVSAIVIVKFIDMLKDAYNSYFKAREEKDAQMTEAVKAAEVAKVVEVAKAEVEEKAEAVAQAVAGAK